MKPKGLGIVATESAPKAIGPYSQAVIVDGMVYTAGQIALDPKTGEVVGKTTVYLVDMADFPAMNEVYARHFGNHKPARSTVQAAALPKGVRVEIDAIARAS